MNAVTKSEARPILTPQTFDQLVQFAEMAAKTDMVPKDFRDKPGNIMLAVQMGSELGLSPMQAIQSIAIINGRPGVWGDALIGICRQSPLCQDIVETFEGEGEARVAFCIATRRGATPVKGKFSVADAKKAGLWGKNVWAQYPDRMLQNRARGFALRDAFPDLLRGLKTAEELRDTPPDPYRGTTIDAKAEPAQPEPEHKPPPNGAARQSLDDRLQSLRTDLGSLHDEQAVEAFANSERVRKAKEWLAARGNAVALRELDTMLADAEVRVKAAPPHDPETGEINDEAPF